MRDIEVKPGRGRVDSRTDFPGSQPADFGSLRICPEKDRFQDATLASEGPAPCAPRDFLDKEITRGRIQLRCSLGRR